MGYLTATLLQALRQNYHPDNFDLLFSYLPEEQKKEYTRAQAKEETALSFAALISGPLLWTPFFQHVDKILEQAHYSWLLPIFKSLPRHDLFLYMGLVPLDVRQKLASFIEGVSVEDLSFPFHSPALRTFLTGKFLELIGPDAIPPPLEWLPESFATKIIALSKTELVEVIGLLAMHDVALEYKKIIDGDLVQRFLRILSPLQKKYLKVCMNNQEQIQFQSMGLEGWSDSDEKLKRAIAYRGLVRFGIAISDVSKEYLWYIIHKLDMGRGIFLQSAIMLPQETTTQEFLRKELLDVIDYIHEGNNKGDIDDE